MHWTEILAIIVIAAALLPIVMPIALWVIGAIYSARTGRELPSAEWFEARPWFWLLAPIFLLFIIGMPLLIPELNAVGLTVVLFLSANALLFLCFLWDAERFHWAIRTVAGSIAASCLLYLAGMCYVALVDDGNAGLPGDDRQVLTLRKAIFAFIFFGIPAFWFALTGRLTFRREEDEEYIDSRDDYAD